MMNGPVHLSGKITEQDLRDVRSTTRSKWYWPKLLAANWYGLTILGIVIWATIAGLIGSIHPNWREVGILWLVVLGLLGWTFFRTKSAMAKQFRKLNATLPDWITLADNGVQLDGPNGAKIFNPWSAFSGWREGKQVILLDMTGGGFLILRLEDKPEIERESVRQFLRSHLLPTNTPITV
jgi:hypothetical protein